MASSRGGYTQQSRRRRAARGGRSPTPQLRSAGAPRPPASRRSHARGSYQRAFWRGKCACRITVWSQRYGSSHALVYRHRRHPSEVRTQTDTTPGTTTGGATRLLAAIELSVDQFVWYLTCCEEGCVQHETEKIRCGCYSCGRGIAAHGAQHRGHTDEGMLLCVSAQNAGTRWPSRASLLLDCLWRWRIGAQRPSSQTCEMSNFRSADSDSPPTPEEHGC